MPPAPPNGSGPSRRTAIIQAATDLFARQGFHGVGMRAIADAVGIRSSSLYHHFPSKVDLLKAISLDYMEDYVADHVATLRGDGPPSERLRGVLEEHVLFFHAHRAEEAVGLAHLRELGELEPESYREVQEVRRRYQHAINDVIEEGVASHDFAVVDPHLATFEVLGLVNSVNSWFQEDGPIPIERVAAEYADVCVDRILGARPARTARGKPRAPAKRRAASRTA